jgi:CRISPR-associated protein Cas2
MYVIVVYDMNTKRVNKMLKLCREYFNWIQNSVLEGEISEVELKKFKYRAKQIMIEEEDSLIIFKNRSEKWLDKEIVGQEKSGISTMI